MTDSELDKKMKMYAEDAIALASKHHGIVLDYSEQSIVSIDRILAHLTASGLSRPSEMSPEQDEQLWIICKVYGGYIGEVMARHIGANWRVKVSADGASVIELFVANRITASPPQKVWKRLTESEYDTILGYYRGLQNILGRPLFF